MFLNTERRCPVILVQDTSGSMVGSIDEVNKGLQILRSDLLKDRLASQRVEIAVVTFGPVRLVQDFVTVDRWLPPRLQASGPTPMGEALQFAVDQLNIRKRAYREAGIPYYRPWIWLVTDGQPTDNWRAAVEMIQPEIKGGRIEMFTIGTDGADFSVLREISFPRPPVLLKQAHYQEMFVWLSQSLRPVSRSRPGSELELGPPAAWGEVVS